jgi:hypothetical protein
MRRRVTCAAHAQERIQRFVGRHGALAGKLKYPLDCRRCIARVKDGAWQKSDEQWGLAGDDTPVEELPRGRRKFIANLVVETAQSELGSAPCVDEVSTINPEEAAVGPFERRDPRTVLHTELGRNIGTKAPARNGVAPEGADALLEPAVFGRKCARQGFKSLAKFPNAGRVAGLPAQPHDLFHRLVYSHRRALLV